jgi:hypothetical protein
MFGITTVLLTSAFFTQLFQDGAWLARLTGIDWKVQFGGEVALAMVATLVGTKMR